MQNSLFSSEPPCPHFPSSATAFTTLSYMLCSSASVSITVIKLLKNWCKNDLALKSDHHTAAKLVLKIVSEWKNIEFIFILQFGKPQWAK